MRKARGAKVCATLGATLIAIATPLSVQAGISGGDILGISGGDAQGISGGDLQGISGGDILGISGGDILGISGGDVEGISGGDVYGISGGDVLGISGGDVEGISGGDVYGISGGDVLGISGGDVEGISGGDVYGISGGDVLGISGGDVEGISGGDVLAGPVEAIDRATGVFQSLGQSVLASDDMLRDMRVGDFVTVEGTVMGPGWLFADAVVVTDVSYVPGATEVFVSGMLTSVDLAAGRARLGNLTIDYTSSLAITSAPSGAMWSFHGVRPVADGLMISDLSNGLTR